MFFLLFVTGRAQSRERLADILWPAEPEAAAKRALRQTLWRANTALRDPAAPDAQVVDAAGPGLLRIAPGAVAWSDVGQFDAAYAAARDIPGERLTEAQAADLWAALELYGEGVPGGRFGAWCGPQRDRLHEAQLRMRELLLDRCAARGETAAGLDLGRAVLRQDPARETTHRLVMRLHDRAGDRAAAIRQYHRCVEALHREYGVRPSAQTEALHRRIGGETPAAAPLSAARPVAAPVEPPVAATGLDGLRERLDAVHEALEALRAAVEEQAGTAAGHDPYRDAG